MNVQVPCDFLLWMSCYKSAFCCCQLCCDPYQGAYHRAGAAEEEGCFMYRYDAATFQLLFSIPVPCRAAVFVEQSFQYLLKLSIVLGRASFCVEIVTECMHRDVSSRIIV